MTDCDGCGGDVDAITTGRISENTLHHKLSPNTFNNSPQKLRSATCTKMANVAYAHTLLATFKSGTVV